MSQLVARFNGSALGVALRRLDIARFLRYCVAGGAATATDFAVLWFLVWVVGWQHLPWYVIAATLSFLCATGVNFSISWKWVFADRQGRMGRQFARFFTVTVVGIAINNGIIVLGVETFGLAVLFAKLIATAVVVFYNFAANNWWAFRGQEIESSK